jgi:putative transposase
VSRPPRIVVADGLYHVVARGNERQLVFRDDVDRLRFLEVLAAVSDRFSVEVIAYCLMGNHFHVLLRTPESNLSRAMRHLNGVYAQRFNRRHLRVGHLFQGRFAAKLVQDDHHLLATVRYIVRNPCRAGLCASPREWHWSSHRATLGLEPPWFLSLGGLFAQLGGTRGKARAIYARLTETEVPYSLLPAGSTHPLVDGDPAFTAETLGRVVASPEYSGRTLRMPRPALETLLAETATQGALETARASGYSLTEIGAYLGLHASTISRRLSRHRP